MHYPRPESLSLEAAEDEDHGPCYIHTDQTFIVFDIDQFPNATEEISISRLNKKGLVAFRFLTNAPTRYLVKPNSGVLADDTAVKVEIQLHGNRYNPKHKLILQAVEIFSKDEAKSIWNSPTLQRSCIQEIPLMLGTTLVSIDKISGFTDTTKQSQACVARVLRRSKTKGADKLIELRGNCLLEMLNADNDRLKQNIEQTLSVRNVVNAQIKQRRDATAEKLTKILALEKEEEELIKELNNMEGEIEQIYDRFRLPKQRKSKSTPKKI